MQTTETRVTVYPCESGTLDYQWAVCRGEGRAAKGAEAPSGVAGCNSTMCGVVHSKGHVNVSAARGSGDGTLEPHAHHLPPQVPSESSSAQCVPCCHLPQYPVDRLPATFPSPFPPTFPLRVPKSFTRHGVSLAAISSQPFPPSRTFPPTFPQVPHRLLHPVHGHGVPTGVRHPAGLQPPGAGAGKHGGHEEPGGETKT